MERFRHDQFLPSFVITVEINSFQFLLFKRSSNSSLLSYSWLFKIKSWRWCPFRYRERRSRKITIWIVTRKWNLHNTWGWWEIFFNLNCEDSTYSSLFAVISPTFYYLLNCEILWSHYFFIEFNFPLHKKLSLFKHKSFQMRETLFTSGGIK